MKTSLLAVVFAGVFLPHVVVAAAPAPGFQQLYSFTAGDGGNPLPTLTFSNGVLFGTTQSGGAGGNGTLFSFDPATGVETVLHVFNGMDGNRPAAPVVVSGGALYGTTASGGTDNLGTAFKLDLVTGALTTLHSFHGSDGAGPGSALLFHSGAFYGATHAGGATNTGTFYKMNPRTGDVTVIHSFGNPDGRQPSGDLVYVAGAFYGAATYGGQAQHGMIFKVDAATGVESVAYTLGVNSPTARDGFYPLVGLTHAEGGLIGSTTSGGDFGLGTMFKIALPSGTTTVLHSFAGGQDQFPAAGLVSLEHDPAGCA